MTASSADTPASGLTVHQPQRGFRYAADAFWLVGFALSGGRPRRAVDLGTGSGVMAMLLARQGTEVLGVDTLPDWLPLWEQTLAESTVHGGVRLVQRDVADGLADEGSFDLVVSNPPFFSPEQGPPSLHPWHAAARFESTATLEHFVGTACASAPNGRVCLILPTIRTPDLHRAVPLGWSVAHQVHVGTKRMVVQLLPGQHDTLIEDVPVDGATTAAWYALAVAPSAAAR